MYHACFIVTHYSWIKSLNFIDIYSVSVESIFISVVLFLDLDLKFISDRVLPMVL